MVFLAPDDKPRAWTRNETRLWGNRFIRCEQCGTRYKMVNDSKHADACRGRINLPRKKRKK